MNLMFDVVVVVGVGARAHVCVCVCVSSHLSRRPQPLVMHLACVTLGMTMSEALAAATINAAASLGRAATHGSLEVGKQADLLVLDAPRYAPVASQPPRHDSARDETAARVGT